MTYLYRSVCTLRLRIYSRARREWLRTDIISHRNKKKTNKQTFRTLKKTLGNRQVYSFTHRLKVLLSCFVVEERALSSNVHKCEIAGGEKLVCI